MVSFDVHQAKPCTIVESKYVIRLLCTFVLSKCPVSQQRKLCTQCVPAVPEGVLRAAVWLAGEEPAAAQGDVHGCGVPHKDKIQPSRGHRAPGAFEGQKVWKNTAGTLWTCIECAWRNGVHNLALLQM